MGAEVFPEASPKIWRFTGWTFFSAKSNQETPPSVIHGWKATDLPFMMVKRKKYFFHPVKRQIFGDASGKTSALILTVCHKLKMLEYQYMQFWFESFEVSLSNRMTLVWRWRRLRYWRRRTTTWRKSTARTKMGWGLSPLGPCLELLASGIMIVLEIIVTIVGERWTRSF